MSYVSHVSVIPTNGNGPTQGQRKTLTRVGIEPSTFELDHHLFSCMLISSPHNLNLRSDSRGTRILLNVFEAVQRTRSTCFIGSKNTIRLVFLNPIKHCCSFFKHYIWFLYC